MDLTGRNTTTRHHEEGGMDLTVRSTWCPHYSTNERWAKIFLLFFYFFPTFFLLFSYFSLLLFYFALLPSTFCT